MMINQIICRALCVRILVVLVACAAVLRGQEWRVVHPGVEYAQVTREVSGLKVDINLLRLDLTKVRLDVVHAMDAAIGTEKTSSIAKRHGAIAAINAGYFRLDDSIWAGDPDGLLMTNYRLLSEPRSDRMTLLIANLTHRTVTAFRRVQGGMELCCIKGEQVPLAGINRERKTTDLVLYTNEFGNSTKTPPGGTELIFTYCLGFCRTVEVHDGAGDSLIPQGGYVISIGPNATEEQRTLIKAMKAPKPPTEFRVLLKNVDDALPYKKKMYAPEGATNGVPQLIKDSKIDITWELEMTNKTFVETRHPRTAVAKLRDGKFLMITVDGRSESSGGIGLQDLAEYLLGLGATDAINLDGGGSTTMFLDDKLVNHPSDKDGERKVGDAILVTLRK